MATKHFKGFRTPADQDGSARLGEPTFPFFRDISNNERPLAERRIRWMILLPLAVMALLTILAGGLAYWRMQGWEQGISRITGDASRAVILNNIRWSLRELRRDLVERPEQAERDWRDIRSQTLLMLRLPSRSDEPPEKILPVPLRMVLSTRPPSLAQVDALLEAPWMSRNLEQIGELRQLEAEATRTTRAVMVGMALLGLLLAMLTVYDLDRIFLRLARSRDLHIRLQEEERRRIARELHDGVVQDLIDLKRHYAPDKLERLISELRRLCHNLKPHILEDLGLAAALEGLADDLRRSGVPDVRFILDESGLANLPADYELPLFRVIQELCVNIRRHAGATRVRLTLAYNPEEGRILNVSLSDDGCGFNPETCPSERMGLSGVRERIRQMDGQLSIETTPDAGTCIRFSIPVRKKRTAHACS